MNIDDLYTQDAHEEGAEINIRNPNTGAKTDVFITVLGPDSKAWRKATKDIMRSIVRGEIKDDDEEDVLKLVAVTTGWRGLLSGGKELKFSKKVCRELYTKAPHIRDQVNIFIGDYKNFTKG